MLKSMSSDELPILNRVYEIYKQIDSINASLPKHRRYSLGASSENTTLAIYENLVMAKHAPRSHKSAYLLKAQAHLEILRIKLRLYLELGIINETRILQQQAALQEVGRMLGGWLKSLK